MPAAPPTEIKEWAVCRACGSESLTPLFSLGTQYISNFVTRAEVDAGYGDCPRCPLELQLCRACTCVQLRHSVSPDLLYRGGYWFKSSSSTTNQAALAGVLAAVRARVGQLGKSDGWLDIGSNDGTLLRLVQEGNPGCPSVGVEPAPNVGSEDNYRGSVLIPDLWPTKLILKRDHVKGVGYKVITALGMLYDAENPTAFVRGVADHLRPDGLFVAQLMCLRQTVECLDVGNFAHEHLLYYSLGGLERMYAAAGLEVFDLETNAVNGGSYRLYARHAGAAVGADREQYGRVAAARAVEAEMRLADPGRLMAFYQDLLQQAHDVQSLVYKARRAGRQVFAYGASTKGNTILQWLGLDHTQITAVADKDPAKLGRFTVGTGIPVVSKEAFRQMSPDLALVLPYSFRAEIIEEEREQTWRRRGGKLAFSIPKLEVV